MESILYGECVAQGNAAVVRIRGLVGFGCDLEVDGSANNGGANLPDGDVALWIGAIGPVAATAERKGRRNLAVRFKEPLDNRIVSHFRSG